MISIIALSQKFEILIFCRRGCWRPSGLLADQWSIQTTSTDHNGAQPSGKAEALWWSHGNPGRHSVDWFGSADCSSHGQRNSEAAAYGCSSWIHHQGAPGRGALCWLVAFNIVTQKPNCRGGCSLMSVNCFLTLKRFLIKFCII